MALDTLPFWLNALIFAASGAAVWWAGTRLAVYVDGIASVTGLRRGRSCPIQPAAAFGAVHAANSRVVRGAVALLPPL